MGSSRLPGKVLKLICGHPMLEWVCSRVKQSRMVDQVLVATTKDKDDELYEFETSISDATKRIE